ncbi:MAG: FprA family A-type flavoprotein [Actinomycetia bacterium]|nr:FprA family A-type flavoprotein [Actinomycetes bacterium]
MAEKIKPNIFYVGAKDPDRRLFDELIPLPYGTTYNAYLIKGSDKTALIDTVDPAKRDVLFKHLDQLGVDRIDYVISNHAEQDHSGSIPHVLEKYPEAKVVTNEKCKGMLMDLLHIEEEKFLVVEDGSSLSLGDKTLEFMIAPWVHWPETMFTYLKQDKILFTCDYLGSHYSFDDLYVTDQQLIYENAKRYYAEIMMPFANLAKKHLDKVQQLELDIIAPSHGQIYNHYDFILEAYRDWTSDKVKNEVVLAYVSMHGSTKEMVDHFKGELENRGITVKTFNLTGADIGELAMATVDAATIALATPTVLAGPHPAAVYAAYLIKALRPKTRYLALFGSYGWGGKTKEIIADLVSTLKAEILEPVIIKGLPREEDFNLLDNLAAEIKTKHDQLD